MSRTPSLYGRKVCRSPCSRAGHYFEIFDAVIEPVVIDVVDLLPRLKPSAKVLLYDPICVRAFSSRPAEASAGTWP